LIGLAVSIGAIFGSVYKAPKIPARSDTLWMAMLVWFILGLIWLLALRSMGRMQPAYSMRPEVAESAAPVTPAVEP